MLQFKQKIPLKLNVIQAREFEPCADQLYSTSIGASERFATRTTVKEVLLVGVVRQTQNACFIRTNERSVQVISKL